MTFGKRVQQLRKQRGLSQESLSEQLEVTRQTISKWELDQSTPDLEYIARLCDFFEVSADYLIRGKENRETKELLPLSKNDAQTNNPSTGSDSATTDNTGNAAKISRNEVIKISTKILGILLMLIGGAGMLFFGINVVDILVFSKEQYMIIPIGTTLLLSNSIFAAGLAFLLNVFSGIKKVKHQKTFFKTNKALNQPLSNTTAVILCVSGILLAVFAVAAIVINTLCAHVMLLYSKELVFILSYVFAFFALPSGILMTFPLLKKLLNKLTCFR